MNGTDESFKLKTIFVSIRDLVLSDQATCTIASKVTILDTKLTLNFSVEV